MHRKEERKNRKVGKGDIRSKDGRTDLEDHKQKKKIKEKINEGIGIKE